MTAGLEGKRIIVTDPATGIGRATAGMLVLEKARVAPRDIDGALCHPAGRTPPAAATFSKIARNIAIGA